MSLMCGMILTKPLWQVRYCAMATLLLTVMYYIVPTRRYYDPHSTSVIFLHLLSFAAHFGAQFWVTFIAGLTMFFNLPRIMFGQVQSRLFPMYFASTLLLSCVTLVTYTIRHPYDSWTQVDVKMVSVLSICVISTFINASVLAPALVDNMIKLFELEKASGVAYVIGHVDRSELKKNPEYSQRYRKFRMAHGLSALANMVTLICNTIYMYHLACLCAYMNLKQHSYCQD